jgi:hypothetical protein
MNKSAYLYFYDDQNEYSSILHLTALCASAVFSKVYLCISERYCKFFITRCCLPGNVEIYSIPASNLESPFLRTLDGLYTSGKLRSNCPPVEKHCINRWLYLADNDFFGEQSLFSIDWDTLVFPGLNKYEPLLDGVDLAATNLLTLGWNNRCPDEPIWSLCPNLLFLSNAALKYYIEYLHKYVSYSDTNGSIVAGLFCDMQPWSSVMSTSFAQKSNLKLLNFNDYAMKLPLIDHNVRVITDCGTQFKEMHYYFKPGSPTYLETAYLPAKHIVFSQYEMPFFVLKHNSSSMTWGSIESTPPCLREAAAIHFSGVEGKHLLLQTFISNVIRYIEGKLGNMYFPL